MNTSCTMSCSSTSIRENSSAILLYSSPSFSMLTTSGSFRRLSFLPHIHAGTLPGCSMLFRNPPVRRVRRVVLSLAWCEFRSSFRCSLSNPDYFSEKVSVQSRYCFELFCHCVAPGARYKFLFFEKFEHIEVLLMPFPRFLESPGDRVGSSVVHKLNCHLTVGRASAGGSRSSCLWVRRRRRNLLSREYSIFHSPHHRASS